MVVVTIIYFRAELKFQKFLLKSLKLVDLANLAGKIELNMANYTGGY